MVAGEIRRHRLRRKLSTQRLADACGELGAPIKRSVLANLESGRRPMVSVPELLAIAEVLEVSPLLLMFPLGHAETVELPGREVDPWSAIQWAEGTGAGPDDPLSLWRLHGRLEDRLATLAASLNNAASPEHRPAGADLAAAWDSALVTTIRGAADSLTGLRARMQDLDLTPPPLHPETILIMADLERAPARPGTPS